MDFFNLIPIFFSFEKSVGYGFSTDDILARFWDIEAQVYVPGVVSIKAISTNNTFKNNGVKKVQIEERVKAGEFEFSKFSNFDFWIEENLDENKQQICWLSENYSSKINSIKGCFGLVQSNQEISLFYNVKLLSKENLNLKPFYSSLFEKHILHTLQPATEKQRKEYFDSLKGIF